MAKKIKKKVVISIKPVDLDNEPIRFGKYRGKTPNQIAKEDPRYLVWMWNNINNPPVTKSLVLDCEDQTLCRDDEDEQEEMTRTDYQWGRD